MLPHTKSSPRGNEDASSERMVARKVLVDGAMVLIAACVITFVLYVCFWVVPQMLGFHRNPHTINRESCDCACWDGLFKGQYPRGNYKSVFFNLDRNMMKIVFICVFNIILFERLVSKCVALLFSAPRQVDFLVLGLICFNFYSNFYGTWALINYYNDDWHDLFWNQIYYTITELATGVSLTLLVDKSFRQARGCYWVIFLLSFTHLVLANIDQMFVNFQRGASHTVTLRGKRDVALQLGDLTSALYALWRLRSDPLVTRRPLQTVAFILVWLVVNVVMNRGITSATHT